MKKSFQAGEVSRFRTQSKVRPEYAKTSPFYRRSKRPRIANLGVQLSPERHVYMDGEGLRGDAHSCIFQEGKVRQERRRRVKASGGLWQSTDTSEWRGQRKGRKEQRKGSKRATGGGGNAGGKLCRETGEGITKAGRCGGQGKRDGVYLV